MAATLFGIDYAKLSENTLSIKHTSKTINSGSYTTQEIIATDVLTSFDISDYQIKSVWVKCGDLKARLYKVPGYTLAFVDSYK
jgi:hypothetical protein